jgi:hypothetical protein
MDRAGTERPEKHDIQGILLVGMLRIIGILRLIDHVWPDAAP